MAVRFDVDTDRISYSGSMPDPTTAITVTAWAYVTNNTANPATFFRLWNAAVSTTITCAINSGGVVNPGYYTAGGSAFISTSLSLGTWYRIAVTCTGTAGKFYLAAGTGGATSVGTGTVSGAATPVGITVGGRAPADFNEWFDGRMAYVRAWPSVLTQAQIEAEWLSMAPIVTSGLWADWPLEVATDLTDHSGNGRHLAAGTTAVTTEEGPPLSVARRPLVVNRAAIQAASW